MAGEQTKTAPAFIPAPTGGINYIDNPALLPLNEARYLQNYLIYPWGIQERTKSLALLSSTYANAQYYPYKDGYVDKAVIFANSTLYRIDSETDSTPTDLGLGSFTGSAPQACYFNKRIYFFNGSDSPKVFTLASGTAASASYTGPTTTDLRYGFVYKSRMYMLEKASANPTQVWYTGVSEVSGTLTDIDFASIFQESTEINCGFSLSIQDGIDKEEVFCLVGNTGEILVYSGDYPESPNWELISRVHAPYPPETKNNRILEIGQEKYINTKQGLLPVSLLLTRITEENINLARLDRKLGYVMLEDPVKSNAINNATRDIFVFAVAETGPAGVYAYNTETKGWSFLKFANDPVDVCVLGNYIHYSHSSGTSIVGLPTGHYNSLNAESVNVAANRYVWKTPFIDLGQSKNTRTSHQRVLGADVSISQSFKNTLYIKSDLEDSTDDIAVPDTGTDSSTISTVDNTSSYIIKRTYRQELRAPGSGKRQSFCFNKPASSTINEIYGVELAYETGGAY